MSSGDVYAAYYEPELIDYPTSLLSSRWFRARLLKVLPCASSGPDEPEVARQVVVLAVDYGFMVTLPETNLTPLPPECRGIPPQVHIYLKTLCRDIVFSIAKGVCHNGGGGGGGRGGGGAE